MSTRLGRPPDGWFRPLGPVKKQLNRVRGGDSQVWDLILCAGMLDVALIRERFEALSPHLDERGRRLFAATEAAAAGYGGIAAVSRITGIAASTIGRGLNELAAPTRLEPGRIRRSGGGRKALVVTDRKLLDDLNGLVEPEARGDPMSPLRWTCKSLRRVAAELAALGHRVSHTVVGELLRQQKFSLQANRKTREGDSHPDRDAQFAYINTEVGAALAEGQAVISVDTKKKELVGDFKNAGREWRRQGEPEEVRVHDFLIKELGRAVPPRRFAAGGRKSAAPITPRPPDSSSPPTAAAPTAIASACGNASCNVWPTRPASPLRCITCPRGPASGTRSSTVYSRSYRKTGGPNRWSAIRSSSI